MWQARLYPELLLLDTNAERKQVLREAQANMLAATEGPLHRRGYAAAAIILISVSLVVTQYLVRRIGEDLSLLGARLVGVVGYGLAAALVVMAIQRLWYKPLRDQLRRELIARGIPVCLHCGYNLTGLTEPRCPECGQPFEAKGDAP